MRAQLTRRALLSLAFRLLLLRAMAVAMRGCPGPYHQLLSQLQSQANITKDPSSLLEPYIHLQGLYMSNLRASCMEHPGVLPSEAALRALSKLDLLRTIHSTLGRVLQGLATIQAQDLTELQTARRNIRGIRNNVHCMAWLLNSSLEAPEPTPRPGASLPPTLASPAFQAKIDGCRFLRDYHRFMGSVGRVLREWGDNPSRSRRHSPRRARHKGPHRTRPSRRGQTPVPRGPPSRRTPGARWT